MRTKYLRAVRTRIAVVAMLGIGLPGLHAAVLNGDFESPGTAGQFGSVTIDDWHTWGTDGSYSDDYAPSMSIKIWWDTAGIWQDWDATPGQSYQVGVQALQPSGDALVAWDAYLKVEFYDSDWQPLQALDLDYLNSSDPQDAWVDLSGICTAPDEAVHGRIVMGLTHWAENASGAVYFDNASMEDMTLPEPGTLALIGVGLLILNAARGRMARGRTSLRG